MKWWYGLLGGVGIIAIWETVEQIMEFKDRKDKYTAALNYSNSVGKPMLVAGGPYGPWSRFWAIPAHGCGAVCLDLNAESCRGCDIAIVADIRKIPYSDKFFGAAFASHIIEHLPTVEDGKVAITELNRVAEKVFIAYPRKTSISAQLHPGHHLWVSEVDNGDFLLEQRA